MEKKIKEGINKARVVSFDIFDTAILRVVATPADVFGLVQNRYVKNNEALPFDFAKERMRCEQELRNIRWTRDRETEVLLDDIYQTLELHTGITHTVAERLKETELATEFAVCRKNPFIYSLYQYALDQGKRIIFISDIYLPHQVISDLLSGNDYTNYHKLYTSSSYKKTKSAGDLYDLVLEDLAIKPAKLVHFGDNFPSDVDMAKAKGIRAYHYEKCSSLACRDRDFSATYPDYVASGHSLFYSLLRGTIMNRLFSQRGGEDEAKNFWYRFGYEKAGVLLLGFCLWLKQKIKEDSVEKLLFLARDGFILQKVFNLINDFDKEEIASEYLFASRRAFNFASIKQLGSAEMQFLIHGTSYITVKQFFERIGIRVEEIKDQIAASGFVDENEYVSDEKKQDLRKLFLSVEDIILHHAEEERKNLWKYLSELEIKDGQVVGIVDIGWNGSLQKSLAGLFNDQQLCPRFHGYYLGTWETAKKNCSEQSLIQGYLCHLSSPEEYKNLLKECLEIFEFIHLAPHGSLLYFTERAGKVVPVVDAVPSETENYKKAAIVQKGILHFVHDFARCLKDFQEIEFQKDISVKPIRRVLQDPLKEELMYLGDLMHSSDFGIVTRGRPIARPSLKSLLYRHKHFQREYENAYWKKGFEKRLKYEKAYQRIIRTLLAAS